MCMHNVCIMTDRDSDLGEAGVGGLQKSEII